MAVPPSAGDRMDIFPFGRMSYWKGADRHSIQRYDSTQSESSWMPVDVPEQGGPHIGVEWTTPRRFSQIVVRYDARSAMPEPGQVKLQYWHHTWPEQWAGGWTAVDDPYNGKWVTAHDNVAVSGTTWVHTFDPLDILELPQADDCSVGYRQSLKVRLLYAGVLPRIESIQVFSDSTWQEAALRVQFGLGGAQRTTYAGGVDIHNGYLLSIDDHDANSVLVRVLYADTHQVETGRAVPLHPDATVVTVHGKERGVSFQVVDALNEHVHVTDLGVLIGAQGLIAHNAEVNAPRSAVRPIYGRVATEPEQSYERAGREIPQLGKTRQGPFGRYCPIGCDANRQEFALRYNGDVFADKTLLKLVGRDTARLLWPGNAIWFRFPTGEVPDFREREDGTEQSARDGYLPIYTSRWNEGDFEFRQTAFSCLLHESPWEEEKKRGDEPVVALVRVKVSNTGTASGSARLWFVVEQPEELAYRDGFVYAVGRARDRNAGDPSRPKCWESAKYDSPRMRAWLDMRGRGSASPAACTYALDDISRVTNAIACDLVLPPGVEHEMEFRIPFITFTGDDGREPIAALDYDAKLGEMADYWQVQIDAGAKVRVPEDLINDFNRANVAHIAITADKDVPSGLYMLGAGTWNYQVYGTETVDQTRSLDLRGYHDRAWKYIEPFVALQGSRRMDGRFVSQEGTLHGCKVSEDFDYQVGDYSLDHGTILWWLGEHYRLTRDRRWLAGITPNVIAACDYVTRERQATMLTSSDGSKAWEYGLLPPAHLDDNPEWMYWYIVNALAYKGMVSAGEVLAEVGHPEAGRISSDAAAYGGDIRRALALSMERSPVVKLLDGTWIPHLPDRAHLYGRDVGWIRDSLYGPIFNIDCGLIGPDSPEATWILEDYEDNVFVTKALGRDIDLEKDWFSQGGITIQSNLLPNPIVYLMRGQVEHAIRAFYNSLAANMYPDVRCFTEHPVAAYGWGAGPFYKTPDESAWLTWMRYLLLMEQGDTLMIAPGTPRKWLEDGKEIEFVDAPTWFGPMSYRIVSEAASGRIRAEITPPKRNPPTRLSLRVRHPSKAAMKSVRLNGEPYTDYDPDNETIVLPADLSDRADVLIEY